MQANNRRSKNEKKQFVRDSVECNKSKKPIKVLPWIILQDAKKAKRVFSRLDYFIGTIVGGGVKCDVIAS
ncbi:hypothetical protein NPIL_513941 [Nephila pilipes]|uniref:Uncharacterized protein n=1 Tax=Nephila pilipes TaxID=299642 RepID=A0A8X6NXJ1_NEPPI|nr:hypothetical protein NPIL_513941 [Nephila pilipes]